MSKKIVSLFVALMLVAGVFGAVTASAATLAELQAALAQITAQIAALSGTPVAPAATATTFTRNLSVGATGADVAALQLFLNTEVGTALPGTTYFGPLTKAAVIKFQVANGVPGTGYVGPLTLAAIASKQAPVVVPPMTGGTLPAGCTSAVGYSVTTGAKCDSTSTGPTTLEGNYGVIADVTSLSQYNNEEVGEGQNDVKVAGVEIEASNDGDIALRSMKISFDSTGNTGSTRLNRYIDSVSIWKGSTKIATANVGDFTESSNVYSKTLALDNGVVVKADTVEKFYITVNAATTIDSGDISGDSWTVDIDNIRFEDGSGVVTTDVSTGVIDALNVGINFTSYSTAADTEFKISLDSTSPTADIVSVSDTANTDNVVLLVGKIQVKGSSDVVLDQLPITFTSVGTGVATATNNVILKIGDKEWNETVPVATALDGTVTFDNLNLTIDAGTTVTFTVLADINDIDGTDFTEGDTLLASLTASNRELIDVENSQGDQLATTVKTGTAVGKAQIFRTSGINLTMVSSETSVSAGTGASDDLGTFKLKFKVTAVGDAVYVPSLVVATTTAANVGAGKTMVLVDRAGTATVGGVSVVLTNVSDTTLSDSGNYKIEDGQSETFEITSTVQLPTAGQAGLFRAVLGGVAWSLTDIYPVTNIYTSNLDSFKTSYFGLN